MKTKTETLHDCPRCGRKHFTKPGLKAHACKGAIVVAKRKAFTIAPAPGEAHAIELSALNLVAAPTVSEEFGQARIYVHALEGMAHGMAAIAVVLGAELQRLHKLFGVQRGGDRRSADQTRSRSCLIEWPDLVQRELGVSHDTARNWMHLAEQARKRLPNFAPIAALLLATPLGSLPDLQRAELVESTRKLLPEESARQLMFDWGIVKKAKSRGGARTKDPDKTYDPNAPVENARDLLLHPLRTVMMRWREKEAKLPLWSHLPPEELREIDGILLDLRTDLKAALKTAK